MSGEGTGVKRSPGRPRRFERGPALEAAMRVFWAQGYEGVSIAGLREAMGGMSSASFYALFPGKAQLFEEAVDHYRSTYGRALDPLSDEGLGPREAVEQTLRRSVVMQTDPSHPLGCMMVLAAAPCDPGDRVFQMVSERRAQTRAQVKARVEQAIADDALPVGTDVEATVGLVHGFLMGISVLARDGVPTPVLQSSVGVLLAGWGDSRPRHQNDAGRRVDGVVEGGVGVQS